MLSQSVISRARHSAGHLNCFASMRCGKFPRMRCAGQSIARRACSARTYVRAAQRNNATALAWRAPRGQSAFIMLRTSHVNQREVKLVWVWKHSRISGTSRTRHMCGVRCAHFTSPVGPCWLLPTAFWLILPYCAQL